MSNSLSPSHSDDLIIDDDEDLDSISVTMQDLTTDEDKYGSPSTPTPGQVIARPGFLPHPQSGTQASNGNPRFSTGSKISVADPRTKFKPTGFLCLDQSEDKNNSNVAALSQINNNVDTNFNIKRTVQNYSGASSFAKQVPAAPKQAISFGPAASASKQQETRKFKFGASFTSSPVPATFEKSNDEDEELRILKAEQEARMRAEKEKMEKIDNIIAMKRLEKQQQQMWMSKVDPKMSIANVGEQRVMDGGQVARKERELALQEMEIKKQTTMLLQMQQNMLMEKRNTEEERRKLEDQRKIMELQMSVKNLERLITEKQGQGSYQPQGSSNRPVRERVGEKRGLGGGEYHGQGFKGEEDLRNQRKRRFMEGRSDEFSNQVGSNSRQKKAKYKCTKLPDDLVLTEITDQGPVKKEDLREADRVKRQLAKKEMEEEDDDLDRYEYEGELDPELVLTEFSENGPVKAGSVDITSTFGK